MRLEALRAENFRNLGGHLTPGPGLNVLIGENGQGKTNWIESVAVLGALRSFRTSRVGETIAFGAEQAAVSGTVRESPEITRDLRVAVTPSGRTAFVNGKKEAAARYLGQLHAIAFTADELEIVRGQPEARRRFLDEGIVSLHPPFVQVFADLARVLKQKNVLLQKARDDEWPLERLKTSLQPWNEQLAGLASRVHRARVRFVERVNEVLEDRLFGREHVKIVYRSSLEGKGDLDEYASLLTERLELRVQAELVAGRALVGPHRDDLEITFDGHDLRRFGSAGQQRSALLLLQLANIAVFYATRGEYPLFLIDDIDAELDYERIGKLLDFLDGKTQTFVTTSKESFVERFGGGAHIFTIKNGRPNPG